MPRRLVGEEIRETLDLALYRDDVEIVTPDDQIIKLKADHGQTGAEPTTAQSATFAFRETVTRGSMDFASSGATRPRRRRCWLTTSLPRKAAWN